MKVLEKLLTLKRHLFLSASEKAFLRLNRPTSSPSGSPLKKILLQMPEDPFFLILFSSVIRILRKKASLEINWIELYQSYEKENLKNRFKNAAFYHRKWAKLYRSNGGNVAYRHVFQESKIDPKVLADADQVFKNLKVKDDVLEIVYEDLRVGDLIYDTFMRYLPAPTVYLQDPFLKTLIIYAFAQASQQKTLLSQTTYDYLFTSYCSYIHHGVMSRSALKYGVKVISFGSYDQLAKRVTLADPSHFKEYYYYKAFFAKLPEAEQKAGRARARIELESRFSGKVDVSTYYMTESAFSKTENAASIFKNNGKKRVVLFLHDFFDSPHIHRYMFYPDFYDWVLRTLEILSQTDYDVFVKPHPNTLPENDLIVTEIISKFPKVSLLSKKTSNLQLIKERFDLGLTVYGTLGHEFPYFGIPVMNTGDNPHIEYDFCFNPKSREEYEYMLSHIEEIPVPDEAVKEKILEFYFMHNFYLMPGKLETEDNNFINQGLRLPHFSTTLDLFLERSQDPRYVEKLDRLVEEAIHELL